MKPILKMTLIFAVFAVAALAFAPSAQACCRPCEGYCGPGVPLDAFCCSGIPEPGNACGFTTCGKWLSQQSRDVASIELFNAIVLADSTPAEDACEPALPWLTAL